MFYVLFGILYILHCFEYYIIYYFILDPNLKKDRFESVIKKMENFETMMLKEINRTLKNKYSRLYLI